VVTDNRARGQDGDDESGVDLFPRGGDLLLLSVRRGSQHDSRRVELSLPHPERAVQSSSLPRRRTGSKLYTTGCMGALLTPPRICSVEGDSGDSRAEARDVRPTHEHCRAPGAPGGKPGKGVHSGNYYKLPQIGRLGAIEELS
jgi:hypothetical protein